MGWAFDKDVDKAEEEALLLREGTVVSSGAFVYLRAEDAPKKKDKYQDMNVNRDILYIGRIESILGDANTQGMYRQLDTDVMIRWMYRGKDLPRSMKGGEKKLNPSEVFFSDHTDQNPAEAIEGVCSVLPYHEYKKLPPFQKENLDIYFWKYLLNTTTGSLTKELQAPKLIRKKTKRKRKATPEDHLVPAGECPEQGGNNLGRRSHFGSLPKSVIVTVGDIELAMLEAKSTGKRAVSLSDIAEAIQAKVKDNVDSNSLKSLMESLINDGRVEAAGDRYVLISSELYSTTTEEPIEISGTAFDSGNAGLKVLTDVAALQNESRDGNTPLKRVASKELPCLSLEVPATKKRLLEPMRQSVLSFLNDRSPDLPQGRVRPSLEAVFVDDQWEKLQVAISKLSPCGRDKGADHTLSDAEKSSCSHLIRGCHPTLIPCLHFVSEEKDKFESPLPGVTEEVNIKLVSKVRKALAEAIDMAERNAQRVLEKAATDNPANEMESDHGVNPLQWTIERETPRNMSVTLLAALGQGREIHKFRGELKRVEPSSEKITITDVSMKVSEKGDVSCSITPRRHGLAAAAQRTGLAKEISELLS